jgi:hypothetical protein
MVWNEQQQPQSPQSPGPSSVPQSPAANNVPNKPGYFANNPLQGPMAQPPGQMSGAGYMPGTNPAAQPAVPVPAMAAQPAVPAAGLGTAVNMPPLAPAAGPAKAAASDDDAMDVDDVEWVNRAKRVITSTQGDPHRQVQLIQHLRSLYLKQRFGRDVHTDED